MTRDYPYQESDVAVVFSDGEIKSYCISASNGIAHHLMQEAAKTGVLVMRTSICIPLASIRHVEIQTVDPNAVAT